MLTSRRRVALALLWLAVLAGAAYWLNHSLQISGDLRKFMPQARTPAQHLLMDELGEGPGSRLLLMSIAGSDTSTLALQSRRLQETLAANAAFQFVVNGGETGLAALPEHLLPYRYLLSERYDQHPLNVQALKAALDERLQDLGSPAGGLVEPLIPSDPTLETLAVAEQLQPKNAPQQLQGVWFDKAGKAALLVAQTQAAGFDPTGQNIAVSAIHRAFDAIAKGSKSKLILTGPGAFSVEIGQRTQAEAQWIGVLDTVGLLLLLLIAYRSWKIPILGVLPLASAGLAGLCVVALLFEGVHGITVAFGFTLIGVVQDYPIHLFSHQRPGISPQDNARLLWPALATGVVATCIAYVTFLFSGVDGLRQLAVFTIAGLGAAALTTRFLLPALVEPTQRDPADSPWLARRWLSIVQLPRPRWSLAVLAVVALLVIVWRPGAFWENDLSKLTPVPTDALAQDAQLRGELGAPDVRYLLAVQAADEQSALVASEALRGSLDALVRRGTLLSYDMSARYLPSVQRQQLRQARLPDAASAQTLLAHATQDLPFHADAFAPFLADLEAARTAPPLRPSDLIGTPLASSVQGMLVTRGGHATALVSLIGLSDPEALQAAITETDAQLVDLKLASESLVSAYRDRVLIALGIAALLLAATVALALRERKRIVRVLVPMALSTLLIVAVLRFFGVELTLFHLIALILAAGLGLDYALFFDHAGENRRDQLRTLHALIVCSLMTVLVFTLLAASSIPVLRAIGVTVTMGVVFNFILALLISRAHVVEVVEKLPNAAR